MEINDEIPLNSNNKFQVKEFDDEQQIDFSHITPIERIIDKNWKIRLSGYISLTEIFNSKDGALSLEFKEIQQIHKYLIETNPSAFENALCMIKAYVFIGGFMDISQAVKNIIEKGVTWMKTSEKRNQLFDLIMDSLFKIKEDSEQRAKYHEALSNQIKSKVLKNSIAAIQLLNYTIVNFGVKYLENLKPYFPLILKTSEGSAEQRKESMNFYFEAYKFLGDVLQTFITDLKKQQIDELEKMFTAYKESKVVAHALRLPLEDSTKQTGKKLEAYDLADGIDIFKKYDEAWSEKTVTIEKWQDRLNELKEFSDAASAPKLLTNNNFSHVIIMFRKILKLDQNINVQKQTLKAINNLILGMRKQFAQGFKTLFPIIIEKLKDKKSIEDAQQCLINFHFSIQINQLKEPIIIGLQDKNPNLKIQLMIWIQKIIEDQLESTDKLEFINSELPKLVQDSEKNVRAQAQKIQTLLQSPTMYTNLKQNIQNDQKIIDKNNPQICIKDEKQKEKTIALPNQKTAQESQKKEADLSFLTTQECIQAFVDCKFDDKFIEYIQDDLTIQKALNYLKDQAIITKILGCVDQFLFIMKEKFQKIITNITVNKELMRIISILSEKINLSSSAFKYLQFLFEQNLGDVKFTLMIQSIIQSQINLGSDSKSMLANLIITILDSKAKSGPKTYAEFVSILITLIQINPQIKLPFKQLDQLCKVFLENKNIGIRSHANVVLQSVLDYQGLDQVKQMKESFVAWQKIIITVQKDNPLNNTTFVKKKTIKEMNASLDKSSNKSDSSSKENSAKRKKIRKRESQLNSTQFVCDLQEQIKNETESTDLKGTKKLNLTLLVQLLSDKSVTQRQKGFIMLEEALTNQNLPNSNLNNLFSVIIERISDSNKPLQKQVISCLPIFVEQTQKSIKSHQKLILENLIQTLTDKNLKKTSIQVIDQIQNFFGVEQILNYMAIALKNENQDLRIEILNHMKSYQNYLQKTDKKVLIGNILGLIMDKNSDIRCLSEDLILILIQYFGEKEVQSFVRTKSKTFQDIYQILCSKFCLEIQDKSMVQSIIPSAPQKINILVEKQQKTQENSQTQSFDSNNLTLSFDTIKADYQEWQEQKSLRLSQAQTNALEQQLKEQGLVLYGHFIDFQVQIVQQIQKKQSILIKYSDLVFRQLHYFSKNIDDQQNYQSLFLIVNKLLQLITQEQLALFHQERLWICEAFENYISKFSLLLNEFEQIFQILCKLWNKKDLYVYLQGLINANEHSYKPILSLILLLFPQNFSTNFDQTLKFFQSSKRKQQEKDLLQLWDKLLPNLLIRFSDFDPNNQIRDIIEILYFLDDISAVDQKLIQKHSNQLVISLTSFLIKLKNIEISKFNLQQFLTYFNNFIHRLITFRLCTLNLEPQTLENFFPLLEDQIVIRLIEVLEPQELASIKPINDKIDSKIQEKLFITKKNDSEKYKLDQNKEQIDIESCLKEMNDNKNWLINARKILLYKQRTKSDFTNELKQFNDIFKCYFLSYMYHYENGILEKQPIIQKKRSGKMINRINAIQRDHLIQRSIPLQKTDIQKLNLSPLESKNIIPKENFSPIENLPCFIQNEIFDGEKYKNNEQQYYSPKKNIDQKIINDISTNKNAELKIKNYSPTNELFIKNQQQGSPTQQVNMSGLKEISLNNDIFSLSDQLLDQSQFTGTNEIFGKKNVHNIQTSWGKNTFKKLGILTGMPQESKQQEKQKKEELYSFKNEQPSQLKNSIDKEYNRQDQPIIKYLEPTEDDKLSDLELQDIQQDKQEESTFKINSIIIPDQNNVHKSFSKHVKFYESQEFNELSQTEIIQNPIYKSNSFSPKKFETLQTLTKQDSLTISDSDYNPERRESYTQIMHNIRQSFQKIQDHQEMIDEKLKNIKQTNDQLTDKYMVNNKSSSENTIIKNKDFFEKEKVTGFHQENMVCTVEFQDQFKNDQNIQENIINNLNIIRNSVSQDNNGKDLSLYDQNTKILTQENM